MSGIERHGPRQIGALLPKITGKVLAKKGFPDMRLVTDWPAIVGPELASYTLPEKLTWPRRPEEGGSDEGAGAAAPAAGRGGHRPTGITLKLRVESHRALEVQYATADIMARINAYFGYRAVTEIRLIQGPVHKAGHRPAQHPDHIMSRATAPLADFSGIEDEGLRDALQRLDAARRGR
jgi:hypothetical protein